MTAEFNGFLSYASLDDRYEDGAVSAFRKRLEAAVRQWTGRRDFQIFQDTKDIRWGQNWRDKLRSALKDTFLLIPIMAPLYFESGPCHEEWELFVQREKELKRNDLILPVYWIQCDLLESPAILKDNPWAENLKSRQRQDWREFRRKLLESPETLQAIDGLALQIKQILDAAQITVLPGRIERLATSGRIKQLQATEVNEIVLSGASQSKSGLAITTAEVHTLIVDAMGRGDYISLVQAIKQSEAGNRIIVRPGFYPGGLVIDKPLEIIGEGGPGEIIVQATGSNCILFRTNMALIRNLNIRQIGGGEWYAVDIAQGRLVLEECDITSQSLSCVAVHNGADPLVRRNRIHDGKGRGVFVYENGQGTFEDNDIFGNAYAGVEVTEESNPTVRRNCVTNNNYEAIWVYDKGRGTFEDNDLRGNKRGSWDITKGCTVTRARNKEDEVTK